MEYVNIRLARSLLALRASASVAIPQDDRVFWPPS
jgi:hypothetical protein